GSVYGEFDMIPAEYDKRTLTMEEGREIVRGSMGKDLADSLLPMFEKAYPERNPADLLHLDAILRPSVQRYVTARAMDGGTVYSYLFDMDFPYGNGKVAWHCTDVPFVFHNTQMVATSNVPGVTDRLEEQIFSSVIAFAKNGDPNHPGLPRWEPSTGTEEKTMIFGADTHQETNFDRDLMSILEKEAAKMIRQLFIGDTDIKH
ncbi:MAG: carboxylesterase family protein, partial [Lachnospiraceae bacterium]|nr:carboxylesterase family protein [Lachnospiraceae bacterium]